MATWEMEKTCTRPQWKARVWALILLAEMRVSRANDSIKKGCESVSHQEADSGPQMIHDETKPGNLAVLCDFDGTITLNDTFEHILMKYAHGDWEQYDMQYDQGRISLGEVMQKQGSMIRIPEMVLVAEMERVIGFRPNFDKLVNYCRTNKIPIGVVSAGIDFVINHLLRMKGWNHLVKLYVAKSKTTPDGISFTLPRLHFKDSVGFKDDTVRFYQGKGRKVAYVGDGRYDMPALKQADYRFAVKGSRLANLCRQENVAAREFADFKEVVNTLQHDLG